jgi:hypothetical protein
MLRFGDVQRSQSLGWLDSDLCWLERRTTTGDRPVALQSAFPPPTADALYLSQWFKSNINPATLMRVDYTSLCEVISRSLSRLWSDLSTPFWTACYISGVPSFQRIHVSASYRATRRKLFWAWPIYVLDPFARKCPHVEKHKRRNASEFLKNASADIVSKVISALPAKVFG